KAGEPVDSGDLADRADEIVEQLKALADPTRAFQGQLPLFPEIYRLEVKFADPALAPLAWDSPSPKPRQLSQSRLELLRHRLLGETDERAVLICQYRLPAFNKV